MFYKGEGHVFRFIQQRRCSEVLSLNLINFNSLSLLLGAFCTSRLRFRTLRGHPADIMKTVVCYSRVLRIVSVFFAKQSFCSFKVRVCELRGRVVRWTSAFSNTPPLQFDVWSTRVQHKVDIWAQLVKKSQKIRPPNNASKTIDFDSGSILVRL